MTIDDLLIRARKMGASDVHVTVGIPPKCRVNGELVTLMEGRILPADSKALVEQMIPGRLVERFNREGEVDFSYAIKGVGRFRVNIFKQRGTMSFVIRLVNTEIPSPESLGLPQSVLELVKKKRGLILVTGPTGSGKSTIAKLIASLWDVNSGSIKIGGVDVKHGCLDRKLLITAIGAHIIRMIPPLIVNEEQCDKAVEIITDAVAELSK